MHPTPVSLPSERAPGSLAGELTDLLAELTGVPVEPQARLEADLGLDSLDVARLDAEFRRRYGPAADLRGYLAGLELDQLIDLTVSELASYLRTVAAADACR